MLPKAFRRGEMQIRFIQRKRIYLPFFFAELQEMYCHDLQRKKLHSTLILAVLKAFTNDSDAITKRESPSLLYLTGRVLMAKQCKRGLVSANENIVLRKNSPLYFSPFRNNWNLLKLLGFVISHCNVPFWPRASTFLRPLLPLNHLTFAVMKFGAETEPRNTFSFTRIY